MKRLPWYFIYKRMKCKNIFIRKVYTLILSRFFIKRGSYIGSGAIFLSQPIFPHDIVGIFISSGAIIGKNPVIFHQVTIGSNTISDSDKKGAPTIGDNCYIGAGAKIIGNVKIGDNVRIGANCVIVKDVPDNSVVVNQPARIIIKEQKLKNEFVNFKK